jgi:hypothetical protein
VVGASVGAGVGWGANSIDDGRTISQRGIGQPRRARMSL